ncbi:MAG TPA: flavin reductase family protein [Cyclobacteriaceae bacterium]|nr:flavin reductase family protein [Cyclobacteriaceae bacterium]
MLTIDPKEIPVPKMHGYLLGAVVPRPIAFASTVDKQSNVNLSPFSFFNCFSANPPILVFSPSRKGRDGSTKHTYENVKAVPEVVINIVNYNMVEQMSLASCEFPKDVNEFVKAGLTEVASTKVKPPRVGESPVAMECKVNQVIELGTGGAAGNLVICEVVLMHIREDVLDTHGRIDPVKLDAVARMGGDYYLRVQQDNIITVPKPSEKLGIGLDQIPAAIRNSKVLTGNDLGRLGNVERLPDQAAIDAVKKDAQFLDAVSRSAVHALAQQLLRKGRVEEAWKVLLASV